MDHDLCTPFGFLLYDTDILGAVRQGQNRSPLGAEDFGASGGWGFHTGDESYQHQSGEQRDMSI